jgi:LCP family protein required for cell wall assembly
VVVIVDPARRTLALLSIPRDAWIPMSFDGKTTFYNKANTAFAFGKDQSFYPNRLAKYRGEQGAGVFAADTMSRLLGVPIRYYLALDFAGFRQMIDAVGGLDIDVPRAFAARYPANDDPSIDPSWTTVRFRAGEQRMNGERAIQYARARDAIDDSGEGSDFARSRRQRLIMEAFKTRLLQPTGLVALPRLLTIASGHVDTNYDLPGVTQLGELMLDWKSVRFHQTALTLSNFLDEATGPDGAYVLVPSMSDHSWTQVRAFVRRLWDDPEAGVAAGQTPLTVVNASGTSGLGGRVSMALARLGYMVRAPASAPTRRETRLLDGTSGKADALVRQLSKDLRAELTTATGAELEGLVLELGSAEIDLPDPTTSGEAAPYSIAGITKFGVWMPAVEEPRPVARAVATAVGTPGPGTPVAGTPGAGTPTVGTPGAGTPHAGTPGAGTPHVGTPGAGTPHSGTPGPGTPQAGTPGAGTPHAGTPGAGTPQAGTPGAGTPHVATPGVGTPHAGGTVPGTAGTAAAGTTAPGTPRAGTAPGATTVAGRPGTATPAAAGSGGRAAATAPAAGSVGAGRTGAAATDADETDDAEEPAPPAAPPPPARSTPSTRPPSSGFGAPAPVVAPPAAQPPGQPRPAVPPGRPQVNRLPVTATPAARPTMAAGH